jgi:hypothetical protein
VGSGNGYAINNTASSYYNNNQLDILKAINRSSGSTISRIFYDYNSNTIRFSFSGSSNNDAYTYIKNFDNPLHIIATYQGGKTNIILNGIPGSESFVYDKTLIQSASAASAVQFVIDGSSLNSNNSGSSSFLISNLAFYNYQLNSNVIKNHMMWANYQDSPNYYSNINQSLDYFDLINAEDDYALYKQYSGTGLKNYKYEYKTSVDQMGIGPAKISPMVFANYSSSNYSINSSSGITWSSSADYLYFSDFGNYITNKFSIMLRASSSVTASNQYLFSLTGVNGKDTMFLQKNPPSSSGYYLYYFDEINKTSTLFASIVNATSTASGSENIVVSYDGSNVYLYASTSSVTSTSSLIALSFGYGSILALGKNLSNNSSSTSSSNTTYYSNLSVFDFEVNNYASAQALLGTNKMIFAPLTSSLTINQYSYVVYEIPTSTLSEPAGGSYLNWDAPDNLTATISYDGGNNWTSITWDSYMFNYNNNFYLENVLVKFEFNQKYNDIQPLRLTLFEYGIYNSYPMISDFRNYSLYPATSSAYNTHSFRHYDNKIVFRPENFGINFRTDSSNTVLGFANIVSPSVSTYGIDFWLRVDDLQASKSSSQVYLLKTGSYALYYTASNALLRFASAAQIFVYVNGASVSNGTYRLSQNESYHLAISSTFPVSSSISINGGVSNTGSINANATYGHIALWNRTPSPSDVQSRYSLFVSNVIQTASTQDNTLFLIGSGYYDSASAYKTGTLML